MIEPYAPCPCLSGSPYAVCCAPFHTRDALPATPEQLMRSRYTAFCLNDVAYLVDTTAKESRSPDLASDIEATARDTSWIGLRIAKTGECDEGQNGYVEFIAFYHERGQGQAIGQLHERSTFRCENGQWYYVDGTLMPAVKLARNEPCFCGSGLKFKRCHG